MDRCSGILNLRGTLVLAALLGEALLCGRVWAQSVKLSGALATELRSGDVTQHRFTPDGAHLVYSADRASNGVFEIFSVPTDGSAPSQRLNGPLPPGENASMLGLGAGERVVYLADQTTPGVGELYSVPADGSASPLRLSPALVSVVTAAFPAGGDFVLYRDSQSLTTYYRVPIDGSSAPTPVFVAPTFVVGAILFSPDRATVLFRTFGALDHFRLYSVPSDGSGSPVLLHDVPGLFNDIQFASDGVHVLYDETDAEGQFYHKLFSVRFDGIGAPVQLNVSQTAYVGGFALDPNSAIDRVAYLEAGVVYSIAYDGTQRVALNPSGWLTDYDTFTPPDIAVRGPDVVFEAHSAAGRSVLRAPLDGSQAGVPLFAPSSITSVSRPEILASGMVVYLAGSSSGSGLYAVPLAGGTPVLLNQPLVPNRGARSFLVHPNEQQVAFLSDAATAGKDELYLAPLDGSLAPLKLNAPLIPSGADVFSFLFTADGLSVAYVADPLIDSLEGVFRAPLDGLGPVVQYNEPELGSAIAGDVLEFRPTRDGKRVVYRADGESDETFELLAVGTFGRENPVSLTTFLSGPPGVRPGFALSPSGERVVFQSLGQALYSLHSAPTTPGPAPLELDSSGFELPLPLVIAPDETRVVYRKGTTAATDYALRSIPIDGSSPPITLHPPLGTGRAVIDFQVSPDSGFVVYRADAALDNVFELFSVPLDGSAPPVRLHAPLPAGRTLWAYRISPVGKDVVFILDRTVAGRLELYSVPIDGRLSPGRLNQALLTDRDVFDFAISPDGRAVAYRANALGLSQFDLFLVPIGSSRPRLRGANGETRSGAVIRLSQLPGARRVETDYRFSADGTELLFRVNNPNLTARYDVYRVPADGSSVPVQLSAPLTSNRTVTTFALSPDESRVVYVADAVTNDVFELFSVPLAGGPVLRLDPLPAFADVSSFRIDAHSERVVTHVDRNADGVLELFGVPIDGSAPVERLNGPLPANADVESDYVLLPLGRTLYRADQETNDILELFVSLGHKIFPK